MTGDPWRVVSEVGDRMVLACGCVMDVVGDAFVVIPCSPTCPAYAYVAAENARLLRPVELIMAEGNPRSHDELVGELNRAERRRRGHRGPK